MPIYEYTCSDCGKETERLQKLSEPDWLDCPFCGKPKLVRTVSAAGFRLSGSGWYETDFKKDGKRNLASASDSSTTKKGDGSKSDKAKGSDGSKSKPKPEKVGSKSSAGD